ncbi:hypothetical protein K9K77_01215 [Candidatus Babeliales bacterium]|nr:hypothetical protein [Candidatus Babeliales bacterium]
MKKFVLLLTLMASNLKAEPLQDVLASENIQVYSNTLLAGVVASATIFRLTEFYTTLFSHPFISKKDFILLKESLKTINIHVGTACFKGKNIDKIIEQLPLGFSLYAMVLKNECIRTQEYKPEDELSDAEKIMLYHISIKLKPFFQKSENILTALSQSPSGKKYSSEYNCVIKYVKNDILVMNSIIDNHENTQSIN